VNFRHKAPGEIPGALWPELTLVSAGLCHADFGIAPGKQQHAAKPFSGHPLRDGDHVRCAIIAAPCTRSKREETEKFKRFPRETLLVRDKASRARRDGL
jgi:hypothetical protein